MLSFEQALKGLGNPLRFAISHPGDGAARIISLKPTLQKALAVALAQCAKRPSSEKILKAMQEVLDHCQGSALSRLELQKLWSLQQKLLSAEEKPEASVASEPMIEKTSIVVSNQPSEPISKHFFSLSTAVEDLPGIGKKRAEHLAQRHIATLADLLYFLPRRYQLRQSCAHLMQLQEGMMAEVQGRVSRICSYDQGKKKRLEVALRDETGSVLLMWFRLPHRQFAKQFLMGQQLKSTGVVKRFAHRVQMIHPQIEFLAPDGLDDSSFVDGIDDLHENSQQQQLLPVYLDVPGIHPHLLRRWIVQWLDSAKQIEDHLPAYLCQKRQLASLGETIVSLQMPPPGSSVEAMHSMRSPWHQRLIYEELLMLQLWLLRQKNTIQQAYRAEAFAVSSEDIDIFAKKILPFTLTAGQQDVLKDIFADLAKPRPMQRLAQGDVGSGKTAVALLACYAVIRQGFQAVLMAPTELLAEQHLQTAQSLLGCHGICVGLLTGRLPAGQRRQVLEQMQNGELQLIIGTHALIQEGVRFHRLALGIVDEQHRFGVIQRSQLARLACLTHDQAPHMLVMTATPIPRTLALTLYGDLDVSVLKGLPPRRQKIITKFLHDNERFLAYEKVKEEVAQGRQAYVVFPLVEGSEHESMSHLRDATGAAEELANGFLAGLRVGLLHGKLSSEDKDSMMRQFQNHSIDVLVSTVVIEVGIDVPNATVMIIEHADRFGLSQLHQLRGRVGRGAYSSFCLLVAKCGRKEEIWRRLNIMVQSQDGFRIAEEDLSIRGPGDFMGTRQAGLPALSFADLVRDRSFLEIARQDAWEILQDDPLLEKKEHILLREQFLRKNSENLNFY